MMGSSRCWEAESKFGRVQTNNQKSYDDQQMEVLIKTSAFTI